MKFWKGGKDCCDWNVVTCYMETGQVVRLDLNISWLHRPLSSNRSLFSLHQLQQLNLAFNDFTFSQIPPEFCRLSRLISSFSRHIPSAIAWLSNLIALDLSSH
ncbi:LRR domain containing protein [Parasponia andersonii]|uniref:LRR domain containing protein n=1 Tax=Parasponia andersonii TaxID=3476 RepID=A0A2P5D174_PARAD|nr:LRR domain containing protein [Parasponia andersonii]